jgi:plasmid stabilization system protein ParE
MPSYELSAIAEKDLYDVIEYTSKNHGKKKVRQYTKALSKCMESLSMGEGFYKEMQTSSSLIRFKHCQHHYVFGLMIKNSPMLIIAIFHERMEVMEKLKKRLQ